MHSSLVGDTITTCGRPILVSGASHNNILIIGIKKAAVFPEPVWAQAIRSRLAKITGMACFWMGVGTVYLDFTIFCLTKSRKLALSNVVMGGGISVPVT
jgi:hypothetical protein